MNNQRIPTMFWAIVVVASGAPIGAGAADTPSPTATPHPRTLGEVKLKTIALADDDGRIVISDANLAALAERGKVISATPTDSRPAAGAARTRPSRSERERWRKQVLGQKRVILELERKRLRIEARIDAIEEGRLDARALARLRQAEIDLDAVEREVENQRKELDRIVREARRHGAEPGWFR